MPPVEKGERKMAKKKYYAVRQGRKTGIYQTWGECKEQVQGYKNSIFKSFSTKEEAENFLSQNNNDRPVANPNARKKVPLYSEIKSEFIAYVDGSYHNGAYSYGCVIFDGKEMKEFSKSYQNGKDAEMHNVAGELEGAKRAIDYAIKENAASIDIYYDYQGIESWANGFWKTNKPATKAYAAYVKEARTRLEIRFHKVKGHSGDIWNEKADQLAKKALGLC